MDRIATFKRTKEIIEENDFFFKKNFGQNFLIDQHVLGKIINHSEITKDDLVIEVGPGIGSLTQELAERAGKVIAIEIDPNLMPILEKTLSEFDNIEYINMDILKVDLTEIIENSGYKSVKLIANLPYNITTPIIMGILEKKIPVNMIVVMIQKEVALRMSAKPSTKEYGSLSLIVQYYCDPYLVANVPSNSFMPRPNVDSAVISLKILDTPKIQTDNEEQLFKLIKTAFSMRRKTLLNCIFSSDDFNFTKDEISEILIKSGLDPKVRGESLTLENYVTILNNLI